MNKLLKQVQKTENKRHSLWTEVAVPAVHTLIVPEAPEEPVLMGLLFLESFD